MGDRIQHVAGGEGMVLGRSGLSHPPQRQVEKALQRREMGFPPIQFFLIEM